MEKVKAHPWDAVEHFETAEDMTNYLNAALENGDPALIVAVLGDIARARACRNSRAKLDWGAKVSTRHFQIQATLGSPR